MSHTSKQQYLESCRQRYPSRNRAGKSAMIDEVSDTLGWDRKHAIKALNGKVTLGKQTKRRGSKPTHGAAEQSVIVAIWKHSEQPCGIRLKQTLPLWMDSYQARHGANDEATRAKILGYSPRTLERITAPHRGAERGRIGRKTGRRFKEVFGMSPQEFIVRTRVQAASEDLIQTDKALSEIALQHGFYDQSAFSRQFRQHVGETAFNYRQRHR